jgi:hypothetical protein
MKRTLPFVLASAVAMTLLIQSLPVIAATTPRSSYSVSSVPKPPAVAKKLTVGTAVYAIVEGNNPALNSGRKACASWNQNFLGYKNLSSNTVCKTAHPTAKLVTGVNGSKNGFWCNGKPQTGVCATALNTCMVCPNCNLNANADTQIGDQYAEMYASCGGTLGSSSSVKSSSSSSSSVAMGKKCSFKQGTAAGGRVLTTCNVKGAPDNFCIAAFGNLYPSARAIACAQNGEVVCNVPCTAPNIAKLTKCPLGAVAAVPSGNCPASSSSKSSVAGGKVPLGGLCKNAGECLSSWGGKDYFVHCVGNSPDTRCSCNMFSQSYSNCKVNLNNTTGGKTGAPCVHGGNCVSGMCLGGFCK